MWINAIYNIIPALGFRDEGAYFLYSRGEGLGIAMLVVSFIVLALAGLVLVLWIIMPFSVFGLKRLLRECIREQKKTNNLLEKMIEEGRERGGPTGPPEEDESELPEILPIDEGPLDF